MSGRSELKKRASLCTIQEAEENLSEAIENTLKTPKRKDRGQQAQTPDTSSRSGTRQRTPRHCAEQAREKITTLFNKNDRPFQAIYEDDFDSSEDEETTPMEEDAMPKGEYGADKEDEDMAEKGVEMFGFKTPKRKMRTPMKTPLKTPLSLTKQSSSKTPDRSQERHTLVPHTPQTVRRQIRRKIVQVTSQVLNSTSDVESSSESEASSEEEEQEKEEKTVIRNVNVDIAVNAEDYFLAQSTAIHTSDRTLNRLKNPRLSQEVVDELLESLGDCHEKEKQKMTREFHQHFVFWKFLLREGFNILAFGLGSKRYLLEEFRLKELRNSSVVVINGYFPGLTIKEILNSITGGILDSDSSFSGPIEQLEFIEESFVNNELEAYIIIHNIDGPSLQFSKEQEILCRLASIHGIHIIASFDNINGPLLWDQQKLSLCRFVHFNCTTFDSYMEEISYENSLLVHQTSTLGLASLIHVFASLTFNAKAIYVVIAKRQLESKDDPNYHGYPFHELYNTCRDKMLVNSDLTLRAQLTEFKDHKLLRSRRNPDGTEVLDIPIENSLLEGFVQKYEENN